MALLCYNGTKECDGCMWCYDHDPYEIKELDEDFEFDSKREKELIKDD